MNDKEVVFKGVSKKGSKFLIRYPSMDDLEQLHRYINAISSERTFMSFQGEQVSIEDEKKYLIDQLDRIKNKRGILFVLDIDGVICGASGIEVNQYGLDHTGIFGLSIAKNVRGEGIGKQFMKVVIGYAKKQLPKLKLLTLTAYANNDIGIKLYEFFGFKTFGQLPKGARYKDTFVDYIFMCKEMDY